MLRSGEPDLQGIMSRFIHIVPNGNFLDMLNVLMIVQMR